MLGFWLMLFTIKGVSETMQNEAKEQKGGFLSMLLGTSGASLLGNILVGKEAIARGGRKETKSKGEGPGMNRAGEGIVKAGYANEMDF